MPLFNYYRFDPPTWVIDPINHRVGIGTAAPQYLLDVDGRARFSGRMLADFPGDNLRLTQVAGSLSDQYDGEIWTDGSHSTFFGNWNSTVGFYVDASNNVISSVGESVQLGTAGGSGYLGIGTAPSFPFDLSTTADKAIQCQQYPADTSGQTAGIFLYVQPNPGGTSTCQFNALLGSIDLQGSHDVGEIDALNFYSYHSGSGLLNQQIGIQAGAFVNGPINQGLGARLYCSIVAGSTPPTTSMIAIEAAVNHGSMANGTSVPTNIAVKANVIESLPAGRTLTTARAVWVPAPSGGGTITNFSGLYVDAISGSGPTFSNTPYALYLAGASDYSYLAGSVGIGQTAPTARLHLPAGTASASTAPLKFTSGTLLGTKENGTMEYDGTHLYFTTGGVRSTIV